VFATNEVVRLTATVTSRKPGDGRDRGIPRLDWQLVPIGSAKPVDSGDVRFEPPGSGQATDVGVELAMPAEEGVYTLRLATFGRKVSKLERSIQIVVVDSDRRAAAAPGPAVYKLVDSFDPAVGGRLRKVALDATGKKLDGPLARLLKHPRLTGDAKPVVLADLNAAAYRLKVAHPGKPHMLEIIGPLNRQQFGSACLAEGDDQGQFVMLGPECSFGFAATSGTRERTAVSFDETNIHRQIFWPNDREPVVVVAGRQTGRPLEVSRVQLYELGDQLCPPEEEARTWEPGQGAPQARQRLVGPYLRQSDLPRNFCGPRSKDPLSGDDWHTHKLAARRLIELLLFRGQNAMLLAVPADVTTAISTQIVRGSEQLPVLNNPSSEDVLELLLRLFDREGLVLIPELQFGELLDLLPVEHYASDDAYLGFGAGRAPPAMGPTGDGQAPRYNPLSVRVQETVQNVVAEFLERYASHASFGGVAFRLGRHSCLQLPGIEWGYDPGSVRRFEDVTQVRIPRGDDADAQQAAYRYLTSTARREWVRFRASEIAAFHRRLTEVVADARPEARVIFSGQLAQSDDGDGASALVGIVRAGINPARLLAEQGLDFSLPPYASDPHVTVLRPIVRADAADATVQSAAASLNLNPTIDTLYRGAAPGGFLQPLASSTTPIFRSSHGLPGETSPEMMSTAALLVAHQTVEASYIHLLAGLDAQMIFEGSGMTPLVPTALTSRFSSSITQLPNVPFRPAGPQIQPIVVRSAQFEGGTGIYVVNPSSLPLTTEMVMDCPATTAARSFTHGKPPALIALSGGKSRLRIELPGYGLWAVQFERAGLNVSETQVTVSDEALAEFKRRIERLNANMRTAVQASAKAPAQAARRPIETREARQAGWETAARQPDSFDGDEVRQLTKTVSSVKLAWEEGRYADCQRMLDGYWGQLLLSMPVDALPPAPVRPSVTSRLRDKLKR
jgi:hypothetical protein